MLTLFAPAEERTKREAHQRELFDSLWCEPMPVNRIRAILQEHPHVARHTDVDDQTPLHVAAARGNNAPLAIIQSLVEAWPAGVRAVTSEMDTPLHLACTRQASYAILHYLVEQDPKTVCMHNRRNERPLHLLVRGAGTSSLQSVQLLVDKGLKALATKNRARDTPLHVACSRRHLCAQLIKLLLAAYPEAAAIPNAKGDFPLHCVAQGASQQGLSAIWDLLVKAFPEAVYSTNVYGQTPVHIASTQTHHPLTDAAAMYTLWQSHPAVLLMQDKRGNTPLHVACQTGASSEILRLLALAEPKALRKRNSAGDTPVHVLCQKSSSTHDHAVESCLVSLEPANGSNAADSTLSLGATSIMSRWTQAPMNAYVERILALVQVSNKVLRKANKRGQLPLHCALQAEKPSIPLLRYLVDEYPRALRHADKQGQLPIHVACCQPDVSYTAIQLLVNAWTMTSEFSYHEDEENQGDTSSSSSSQPPVVANTTSPAGEKSGDAVPPTAAANPSPTMRASFSNNNNGNDHHKSSTSDRRHRHHHHDKNRHRPRSASIGESHGLIETTVKGNTPLHLACRHNLDFDIIQFLVHHGPGATYIPNAEGRTPLDLARKYGTSKEMRAWVKRVSNVK